MKMAVYSYVGLRSNLDSLVLVELLAAGCLRG